ncbi:MAG: FtsW/RodA/SpoVE family cell cycle protein [Actinobacteria bacterium]|nr:FtsW/RodA/SpoVE family cell cycle protein [Actinomycetota bacterium]
MDAGLSRQARSMRGAELGLIILAIVLAIGAYLMAGYGRDDTFPPSLIANGLLFTVGYLGAHLAVRRFAPTADPVFLPTAGLLAGIGFAVIFRLEPSLAPEQAAWLAIGLIAFVGVLVVIRDHRTLDQFTYSIGLLGIALLLLPVVPGLGRTINGARLWIALGPLSFQPAEIGKILIVIFLASYLNAKKELLAIATRKLGPFQLPEPKHLGPLLVAWGVSLAILFLEKDLGSSLLFFAIFVVMLYVATARGAYLAAGAVLFAVGATLGYFAFAHVQDRVTIWLHALDPAYLTDKSFQLAQSLFALATGGISGTGLGQGSPDLIPYAQTDFIFSAIGEELGLFGTIAVLLLFLTLVVRGFRTAVRRDDGFGKLLAVGLSTSLAVQTFVILGGVTRLIPLTGITLPFVSYGGSSLVANFALLALLARISAARDSEEAVR